MNDFSEAKEEQTAPAFDVLTALSDLAEPLAPAIASIRVALAVAEPVEESGARTASARETIRTEGEGIIAEYGLEGLSFALVTITSEAGDRADAFEAVIQAAWAGLPLWGSASAGAGLSSTDQEGDAWL